MAKKITEKKRITKKANKENENTDQFNDKICKLKHDAIEKEFDNVKTDAEKRHEELKNIIETFSNNVKVDISNIKVNIEESHNNLKNKIVLTEKTIGEKIDKLSEFDDTLKGNGKPGIWECIRLLKLMVKIIISVMFLLLILQLGGNFRGVTWDKIKNKIGFSNTETKQVDTSIPKIDKNSSN